MVDPVASAVGDSLFTRTGVSFTIGSVVVVVFHDLEDTWKPVN